MEIAETFTSQNDMLKEWLEQGNTITGLEASIKFGIGHLPRRIADLKEKGMKIESHTICVTKSNGKTARVSLYYKAASKLDVDYNLFGEPLNNAFI